MCLQDLIAKSDILWTHMMQHEEISFNSRLRETIPVG